MSTASNASANKKFIIAKFGVTSVANFETMYKSADIVITNKNVRIVVLSTSSGITNLLLKLTEACNDNRRKVLLKQIRQCQYRIINHLDNPSNVQPTIDHLLVRLTTLSEVTTQYPLAALQIDEIISYGELMSSYLYC